MRKSACLGHRAGEWESGGRRNGDETRGRDGEGERSGATEREVARCPLVLCVCVCVCVCMCVCVCAHTHTHAARWRCGKIIRAGDLDHRSLSHKYDYTICICIYICIYIYIYSTLIIIITFTFIIKNYKNETWDTETGERRTRRVGLGARATAWTYLG